jgi:vancomycin permeability regulator SanA
MSNPLYKQMGNASAPGMSNFQNLMQRFQQFRQAFSGDPRQQVQNLLNSGRVSQTQYNNAVQMAQQLQRMMGGR